ncbi:ABC transporter substrate-binding protein [Cylindrospermopsis raciborskii]|nr:ABC transporter substrate-binding protein [Cylindrospermopsis raciborskii]
MQLKSFTLSKLHAKVFKYKPELWQKYEVKSIRTLSLLFGMGLGLTFLITACSPSSTNNAGNNQTSSPNEAANSSSSSRLTNSSTVIRIGYQKAATVLYALKAKGELEKSLQKSGVSVTWTEFPAGPPMLEALNAGSIDFGYTGEAPPVFAQAAGTPLLYVAYDPLATKAEAIIVHKDSPIKSLADLKGKKVAFAKGSNTNYLIVKALEKVGLKYSDIKPTFLHSDCKK